MPLMYVTAQEVLEFWFSEEVKQHWFQYNKDVIVKVRVMYEQIFRTAVNCELSDWRDTIYGRLAEIIILDQFSRLMFRGKLHAYTQDRMALLLAQEAIRHKSFPFLEADWRQFILMPFMHSESQNIHNVAVGLFERFGTPESVLMEAKHKAVIDRFGRYPHRNAILNRQSTPEELAFLQENPRGFE